MAGRFWVPGPMPGMNEIIAAAKGEGGRGLGYSRLKKLWTNTVALHAMSASLHRDPCERIRLDLVWVEKPNANGAARDPDNIEAGQKFLWDGLKLAKVIPDDKAANNAGSSHRHERGPCPGVWVTVVPV